MVYLLSDKGQTGGARKKRAVAEIGTWAQDDWHHALGLLKGEMAKWSKLVLSCTGLRTVVHGFVRFCTIVYGSVRLCTVLYSCVRLCTIVYGFVRFF